MYASHKLAEESKVEARIKNDGSTDTSWLILLKLLILTHCGKVKNLGQMLNWPRRQDNRHKLGLAWAKWNGMYNPYRARVGVFSNAVDGSS